MKFKLEKRIELCDDCGLGYYKPFYEPMWLSRILWKSSHDPYHHENYNGDDRMGVGEQWRQTGRDQEREQIIKLLIENKFGDAAALIKGQDK